MYAVQAQFVKHHDLANSQGQRNSTLSDLAVAELMRGCLVSLPDRFRLNLVFRSFCSDERVESVCNRIQTMSARYDFQSATFNGLTARWQTASSTVHAKLVRLRCPEADAVELATAVLQEQPVLTQPLCAGQAFRLLELFGACHDLSQSDVDRFVGTCQEACVSLGHASVVDGCVHITGTTDSFVLVVAWSHESLSATIDELVQACLQNGVAICTQSWLRAVMDRQLVALELADKDLAACADMSLDGVQHAVGTHFGPLLFAALNQSCPLHAAWLEAKCILDTAAALTGAFGEPESQDDGLVIGKALYISRHSWR